jgi:hypothetical protein
LNSFTNFHEIWDGGNAIQGNLDAIFLIPYLQPFQNGLGSNFFVGDMIFSLEQQWFGIV